MLARNFFIFVILAYRLIPRRIRRVWSFGYSTSHLGLAAVRESATAAEAAKAFFGFTIKPGWGDNDFNTVW